METGPRFKVLPERLGSRSMQSLDWQSSVLVPNRTTLEYSFIRKKHANRATQ